MVQLHDECFSRHQCFMLGKKAIAVQEVSVWWFNWSLKGIFFHSDQNVEQVSVVIVSVTNWATFLQSNASFCPCLQNSLIQQGFPEHVSLFHIIITQSKIVIPNHTWLSCSHCYGNPSVKSTIVMKTEMQLPYLKLLYYIPPTNERSTYCLLL